MNQLIAIDPTALDALRDELARLHKRLDQVEMQPRPEWITAEQFAKQVGKSLRTVKRWTDEGKIETKRVGAVLMVRSVEALGNVRR